MPDPGDILEIADSLDKTASRLDTKSLSALQRSAESVAKSASGSWLGYHSRIYYKNFQPVPPRARFSAEWGFGDRMSNETRGEWEEYDYDAVVDHINEVARNPDDEKLKATAQKTLESFEEAQAQLLSLLTQWQSEYPEDKFLEDQIKKIREAKNHSYSDYLTVMRPRQVQTRDAQAAHEGIKTPPHFHVIAQISTWRNPFTLCEELAKFARRAGSHVASLSKKRARSSRVGTHIFIGHGRSLVWKDFRDFIRDRLKLPWDEFNRVPVAGVPTTTRLMQMLDDAAIAFLILTAEDEQADGRFHPRLNVIHEAGLFQGRLGLERAIILLEDGCEEFSNVHGLGQIRFPKGKIGDAFEEVRRVLEREDLIPSAK
jgi:predicted nucleotide-binding protein